MSRAKRLCGGRFDVLYSVEPHGWSSLLVIDGDKRYLTDVSHVFSDPVGDLMGLCQAAADGSLSHVICLPGEPGVLTAPAARAYAERNWRGTLGRHSVEPGRRLVRRN